jgi:hypothetical protein
VCINHAVLIYVYIPSALRLGRGEGGTSDKKHGILIEDLSHGSQEVC